MSKQIKRSTVRPNCGDFDSEAAALEEVVRRLADQLQPVAIWLFGSRAIGRHRPDSDFDLLVVAPDSAGDGGRDYDRVYAPIAGLGVGVDVVPCTQSDFEEERHAKTGLVRDIACTGRLIYGQTYDSGVSDPCG